MLKLKIAKILIFPSKNTIFTYQIKTKETNLETNLWKNQPLKKENYQNKN